MQLDLWQELMRAMESRRQVGLQTYKVPFVAGDGRRDGALDLLEELLDAAVYVLKLRKERNLLRQGLLRAARMRNTTTMSHEILSLVDQFLLTEGHRLDGTAALHELPESSPQVEVEPLNILPMTDETRALNILWPFDNRVEIQTEEWEEHNDADE